MRLVFLLLPLALLLPFGCDSSGTGDAAAGGAGGETGASGSAGAAGSAVDSTQAIADCKAACVIVDGLKCFQNTPGECDKLCDSTAKAKTCAAAFAAYSSCAKSAEWKCDGGFAQVASCTAQQKDLAACLTAKGSGNGTLGEQGNFFCDKTVCDGSPSERACCLKLDLSMGGVVTRCTPSLADCGEDSRWECDGPDDCGGRPCCWAQQSSGSGQTVVGLCRDACNPFLNEHEVCYDTCTGGQLCCKAPGDKTGTCQPDQVNCDAKLAEQQNQN